MRPLLFLAAGFLLAGCSKKEEPAPAPPQPKAVKVEIASLATNATAESSPAPPPAARQEVMEEEPGAGPSLDERVRMVMYGIHMFHEEKGRFPASLNEVVDTKYVRKLPAVPAGQKLTYDPHTGLVKIEKAK